MAMNAPTTFPSKEQIEAAYEEITCRHWQTTKERVRRALIAAANVGDDLSDAMRWRWFVANCDVRQVAGGAWFEIRSDYQPAHGEDIKAILDEIVDDEIKTATGGGI